jgi:hypothetical protein
MVFKESILKYLLPSQIEEICQLILPNGVKQGCYWKVGSVNGEKGKSLSICLNESKAGLWKDFATEECGNILGLIKSVLNLDTRNAFGWLESRYGNAIHDIKSPSIKPKSKSSIDYANEIWSQGLEVKGTIGEKYFQSRGIYKPIPLTIRFIDSLPHTPNKSSFPALLCAIQNRLGGIQGVQRIYLSKDGQGKAEIESNKMILGEMKGHAIRLGEASTKLGICEGVETGLSIWEAGVDFPIWSAISAANLSIIQIPKEVEEVVLLPDGDKVGELAAIKAAERFFSEGKAVRIARPPKNKDFNDLLCEAGEVPHAS